MSTSELKHNLLKIIDAINDNSTLKDIYSFVTEKTGSLRLKRKRKSEQHETPANEKREWDKLSASMLSRAYGEDEPDYSNAVIIEPNPEYRK